MTIHVIIGMTIGTHRIAAAIKRRNDNRILVVDELHEGPPHEMLGVTYCSKEQSQEICKDYSNVIYHLFRNRNRKINIHNFDFR